MASNEMPLPGSTFTKNVYRAAYPAISPTRPELSQAGKTVLITGGSAGIGLAIAHAFSQAGAQRVIILGRREERVRAVAAELGSEHPKTQVSGRAADVSDLASLSQLWDDLAKDGIVIDVLVLNAAAAVVPKTILNEGREDVWSHFLTNVQGHLAFAERLHQQAHAANRSAVLVNVSTQVIHNLHQALIYPSYSVSKSAGTMLLQNLALNVDPSKFQVVSFHPGVAFTEAAANSGMTEQSLPWDDTNLPGQFAVWAASPEARFLHGRYVWAAWDVDELRTGPVRKRIDEDIHFLRVGVVGIEEWENRK
ncbi:hypothetical protein ACJ41O_014387 [Fusarium nematophilum]